MASSSPQVTATTKAPAPTSTAPNWQDLLGAFTAFNQLNPQRQPQTPYAMSVGQAGLAQSLQPPGIRPVTPVRPLGSYLMGGGR